MEKDRFLKRRSKKMPKEKKMEWPVETRMMRDNEMSDEVTPCTVLIGQVEQIW